MVKATEISVVIVQSADGIITEKDDQKPGTVLLQEGEDDMPTKNISVFKVHETFLPVEGLQTEELYVKKYICFDGKYEGEQALVVVHATCRIETNKFKKHHI